MLTPDQEIETLSSTTDGAWTDEAIAIALSLGAVALGAKDSEGWYIDIGPYEVQEWFDHKWAVNVPDGASIVCGTMAMAVRVAVGLVLTAEAGRGSNSK
jgi:hypothetical protein